MPRKPSNRLACLDPAEVVEQVFAVTEPDVRTRAALSRLIGGLCEFAKSGTLDVDLGVTHEQVRSFVEGQQVDEVPLHDESDVELVTIATMARLRLAAGELVRPREIAVLAGVTASAVYGLMQRGVIAYVGAGRVRMIPADAARSWLRTRNVPGFE